MGLLTVHYNDSAATFLLFLIRRMAIRDALVSKPWRLERIDPLVGFEHYILYCGSEVVGVQYVRAASWLDPVQHGLAAYLTVLGFRPANTDYLIDGARTSDRAEHNRLPHLFALSLERRRVQVAKVGHGLLRPPYRLAKLRHIGSPHTNPDPCAGILMVSGNS